MRDEPRIQALRIALDVTYPDSTAPCNEMHTEIGWGRAGLTIVILGMSNLLDPALADRPGGTAAWITAQRLAELDAGRSQAFLN